MSEATEQTAPVVDETAKAIEEPQVSSEKPTEERSAEETATPSVDTLGPSDAQKAADQAESTTITPSSAPPALAPPTPTTSSRTIKIPTLRRLPLPTCQQRDLPCMPTRTTRRPPRSSHVPVFFKPKSTARRHLIMPRSFSTMVAACSELAKARVMS
ncbi:hypothetical protein NW765_000865 [Fusarium oxysporum]|nr:hypothetical protein NW765_000865 [Fusarium oxysporum]